MKRREIQGYALPELKIVGESKFREDTKPIDYQNLGLEERKLIQKLFGMSPRLNYPTILVEMANGKVIEFYDIPEEDKQKVFERLYLFEPKVDIDHFLYDIHAEKEFYVRDFLVTREGQGNFLVSPFYAESGGTVLDWVYLPEVSTGLHVAKVKNNVESDWDNEDNGTEEKMDEEE